MYNDQAPITIDLNVIGDKPHSALPFGTTMAVTSEPPAHVLRVRRAASFSVYVGPSVSLAVDLVMECCQTTPEALCWQLWPKSVAGSVPHSYW